MLQMSESVANMITTAAKFMAIALKSKMAISVVVFIFMPPV